jgi:hypothetical protein
MDKCFIIGEYEISDLCIQLYPCQHYVKHIKTGKTYRLYGDHICKLLKKDGLSHSHFDNYNNYNFSKVYYDPFDSCLKKL